MMVLNGLFFLVLLAVVYYVPGRLLLRFFPAAEHVEETFPAALGLGIIAVNVPAILLVGLLGLVWPVYMRWFVVVGVSLAASAGLVYGLVRKGRWSRRGWFVRPGRRHLVLAAVTVLATLFYLVHFDFDFFPEDSCVVRAATAINVDYGGYRSSAGANGQEPDSDAFLMEAKSRGATPNRFIKANQGQRLGPSVLVSPFLALFGIFGFRLVYALQGLLLPGLGFVLGMALFNRRWAAWLFALGLTFSPYALELQGFDENVMSSCFGTLMLVMLLRREPAPFAAGMALSLFLGIRHVGVLMVPAPFFYLWLTGRKLKEPVRGFVEGAVAFAVPYLVLHYFVFTELGHLFEGAIERPPAPHSFFGLDFNLSVLLNWPFVAEPLRSPYNGFPTLLAFPLDLVRRFSWPLIALVPAGLAWLVRNRRAQAWLLVGWLLPLMGLLMVQSNWSEPNKMGIPATASASLLAFLVAGVVHLADRTVSWRRRGLWLALGIALPGLLVPLLQRWDAPEDWRVYGALPSYITEPLVDVPPGTVLRFHEDPAYVAWDRDRYGLALLPDMAWERLHPRIVARRAAVLAEHLASPSVADYHAPLFNLFPQAVLGSGRYVGPVTRYSALVREGTERAGVTPVRRFAGAEGTTQRVALDLASPPALAEAPLELAFPSAGPVTPVSGPVLDVTGDRLFQVHNLAVTWADSPVNLLAGRDHFGTVFLGVMPGGVPEPITHLGGIPVTSLPGTRYAGGRIPLQLPTHEVIRLLEMRSMNPSRLYIRYAIIGDDGALWLSAARPTSLK